MQMWTSFLVCDISFFFLGQWPHLNLFRAFASMYRDLSYSSCSGQLECLLRTISEWCYFAHIHMILVYPHQVSATHRCYTQAVVTCPQAVRAPCPTFLQHTPQGLVSQTGVHPHRLRAHPALSHRHRVTLVHPA